jgi:hypothetical protein
LSLKKQYFYYKTGKEITGCDACLLYVEQRKRDDDPLDVFLLQTEIINVLVNKTPLFGLKRNSSYKDEEIANKECG